MGMDWRGKGRAYFDSAQVLIIPDRDDELAATLREEFADLLAAVRWMGERECGCRRRGMTDACTIADSGETEALHLLTEGFRERLRELAATNGETP